MCKNNQQTSRISRNALWCSSATRARRLVCTHSWRQPLTADLAPTLAVSVKLSVGNKFVKAADEAHVKSLGPHPAYPPRRALTPDQTSWSHSMPNYRPSYFVDGAVLAADVSIKGSAGWADPEDVTKVDWVSRVSYEEKIRLCSITKLPLNPVGRTGLCGRGLLGKWGANHAADPIVTRACVDGGIEVVVIKRKDTGEWALPGGMVDAGGSGAKRVGREFTEEACNISDPQARSNALVKLEELWSNGEIVYSGYVDDPRNTDNAWCETTAFHFHCGKHLGESIPLNAGDDAISVKWIKVGSDDHHNLYASHKSLVDKAYEKFVSGKHEREPEDGEEVSSKRARR